MKRIIKENSEMCKWPSERPEPATRAKMGGGGLERRVGIRPNTQTLSISRDKN